MNNTLSTELNRVRLGTNNTDRNSQILIELLQGFMQMQNLEHIVTTDLNKPPFLTEVENLVHEKITTMKQRKDSTRAMKYNEFDLFTVDQIKEMIGHDIEKAMDLFADSYVATYRIAHDIIELQNVITKQHHELRQALELCVKC